MRRFYVKCGVSARLVAFTGHVKQYFTFPISAFTGTWTTWSVVLSDSLQ